MAKRRKGRHKKRKRKHATHRRKGKGKIPLKILEKRLKRLRNVVISRGGKEP